MLLWQSRRGAGGHRSLCPQGIPASGNLQRARQGGAAAVSSCLYTLLTQDTKLRREITAVFKHRGFNTAVTPGRPVEGGRGDQLREEWRKGGGEKRGNGDRRKERRKKKEKESGREEGTVSNTLYLENTGETFSPVINKPRRGRCGALGAGRGALWRQRRERPGWARPGSVPSAAPLRNRLGSAEAPLRNRLACAPVPPRLGLAPRAGSAGAAVGLMCRLSASGASLRPVQRRRPPGGGSGSAAGTARVGQPRCHPRTRHWEGELLLERRGDSVPAGGDRRAPAVTVWM